MSRRIGIHLLSVSLASTLAVLTGCASHGPLRDFSTDGCSLFPDRSLDGKKDWCHCCVLHDLAYWRGGTAEDRHEADRALKTCVRDESGSPALATVMFLGTRLGGGPYLPMSFRWGYGWPFAKPYGQLKPDEQALANALQRRHLDQNPALACPDETSPKP